MPSTVRDGLRVALNRPRVFGVAAGALLTEVALRAALSVVHPVLAVVCPPVVALPVLGAAAPGVSARVADPDESRNPSLGAALRARGPRLLGVAVGGHLVALALGAAAFLLLDTPVRYAVYAAGGTISKEVVYLAPLAGVAAGALLAWGLLAPAVGRAAAGDDPRAMALAPLRALGNHRRSALALGVQAACVAVALCAFAGAFALADARYPTRDAALLAFAVLVAVAVGTLVLVGVLAYPVHVALARERASEARPLPLGRVALVALLVSGLVVGAGAIRVSETRPGAGTASVADASLPEDATDAYAAARERTVAGSYRVVARENRTGERGEGDAFVAATAVDRDARRFSAAMRYGGRTHAGYADGGVAYRVSAFSPDLFALGERRTDRGVALALPGYWQVTDDGAYTGPAGYGLPEARTGTWTTVREGDGTRTLALSGGPAVFDALQRGEAEDVNATAARVTVRVDTARGVVLGGRGRLNATVGDGEHRLVRNVTYAVETGDSVEVRRPDALGARSLGEWTWDVFAY